MTDPRPTPPAMPSAAATGAHPALPVVRALAFTLANAVAYTPNHNVTRQSAADTAAALAAYYAAHGDLQLDLLDGGFVVAGMAVGPHIAVTAALAKRMGDVGATAISLAGGLETDEILRVVSLLLAKPGEIQAAGGFAACLKELSLTHVSTATFTYQRVEENEVVVPRERAAGDGLAPEACARIRAWLDNPAAGGDTPLAGLDAGHAETARGLVELTLPDAPESPADAEAVARLAATRVRALCDGLLANPANRTQKGRRALKRLLAACEEEMRARLGAAEPQDEDPALELASAVRDLSEELAIDGLVARYLKQRSDVSASESRLVRQLRRSARNGAESAELHARMVEAGLPESVWQMLRGLGSEREPSTPPASANELNELLQRLAAAYHARAEGAADESGADPATLLAEIVGRTARAAAKVEAHLDRLAHGAADEPPETVEPELTKRQVLAIMAELGQELRQPLTVVVLALEMLLLCRVGPLTDGQRSLVETANEQGQRLDGLIARMIEITGLPKSLRPDSRALGSRMPNAE